jgi:hypothetical protein
MHMVQCKFRGQIEKKIPLIPRRFFWIFLIAYLSVRYIIIIFFLLNRLDTMWKKKAITSIGPQRSGEIPLCTGVGVHHDIPQREVWP